MIRNFKPSIWTFIWYHTVNLSLQMFLKQWFNHQDHQIIIQRTRFCPPLIELWLRSTLVTLREALHQHQKTCYDMKILHLFSDSQTMWKGHSNMKLKIVTSSLEGKWNLFLPGIILDNRLFRLNWLLMKIAQAIKFTIPFTCCIQIKNIYSRWKRLRTHALKTQGVKKGLKMLVSASFESNLWLTVLNEDTGEIWWLPRMPCLM